MPLVRGLGRARALTSGPVRDTRPRISPDGRRVAFRRKRRDVRDAVRTLEVLAIPGLAEPAGRPWTLAAPEHGAGELAWSPRSDRIAFTAETDPPRFLIAEGRGKVGAASEDAGRSGTARTADHPGRLAL